MNEPQTSSSWRKGALGIALVAILLVIVGGLVTQAKKGTAIKNKPVAKPVVVKKPTTTPPVSSNRLVADLAKQNKLQKFANAEELRDFIERNSSQDGNVFNGGGAMMKEMAVPSRAMDTFATGASQSGSLGLGSSNAGVVNTDFSKTNNQVEGVDEADIVKTDGTYIYTVNQQNLIIAAAYPPAEGKVVGKINFRGQPRELFVNGNKLVVFGQTWGEQAIDDASATCRSSNSGQAITDCLTKVSEMPVIRGNFTFAKVYDISDKANPKLTRDLSLEGDYTNARLIGDYVYFISNKSSFENGDDVLPRIMHSGKLVANDIFWPVYYFDMSYDMVNFTTVMSFNLANDTTAEQKQAYLLSPTQTLFVSENNIYLTYTKYLDEYTLSLEAMRSIVVPRLSDREKSKISLIENTNELVLSKREKLAKIGVILYRYINSLSSKEQTKIQDQMQTYVKQQFTDIRNELEKTVVHKIAIKDGNLTYQTMAEVSGSVLNQFSMDEKDGYLRIATTKNQTWSDLIGEQDKASFNNLYVLDDKLKVVGTLSGLAKGERLYSARFIGNRAYLVTFKQVDPLFVIDLKDPKAPAVLGELKIPGFSNYLHPYDENTLIGFGKDTAENQWGGVTTGGLKLSLFDVSQVDKPQELDKYVLGDRGSDSIALNDHRAFLFSKEKNILAVPVSLYQSDKPDQWGKFVFGGVAVFNITDKKFKLAGKIDHSDSGRQGDSYSSWGGYSYYDSTVQRSLYIKDILYTVSGRYIKMNTLGSLAPVGSIALDEQKPIPQPQPIPTPYPMPVEPVQLNEVRNIIVPTVPPVKS